MELNLVALLLLLVATVKAQDCEGGSFYDDINSNKFTVQEGYWYLNLEFPCTCSGKAIKYEAKYYNLGDADYRVHVAVWKPTSENVYEQIASSIKRIRKDNSKRKKRGTSGNEDADLSNDSIYIRKGTIVGVYFKNYNDDDIAPMPVIGTDSSGGHSVCIFAEADDATSINCTSSLTSQNQIVHAEAHIETIECDAVSNNFPNGDVSYPDGDKEYGARAMYTCNEGYEITSGDEYLTCNENEQWVGNVPTCTKVNCGMISDPQNGTKSGNNFEYEGIVTFSCNTGYKLNGTSSITCLASGQWNDTVPTCEIVTCPVIVDPENGYRNGSKTTYLSFFTFGCNNGYELSDNYSVTCQANGAWSSNIPTCNLANCTDPGTPANGNRNGHFTYGSVLTFSCNEGYYLDDLSHASIICQADKSWNSSIIPECIQIQCSNPGAPINGTIDISDSDYAYGTVVSFGCDTGFELIGSKAIACVGTDQWNSTVPNCSLVDCGPPSIGQNTLVSPEVYTYPSVIEFTCTEGYELADIETTAMCQANGDWTDPIPECEIIKCANPGALKNGSVANTPSFTYNSVIQYKCDEGFELIGSKYISCNASKQWNNSVPTCEIVKCNDPDIPVNGMKVGNDSSYVYQSIVTFTCDSGYELGTISSIMCTSSGSWNDSTPTCNPVDCGEPNNIINGTKTGTDYTYGNVVQYQCNVGYRLVGSNALECNEKGAWNASEPVCEIVVCPILTNPVNGYKIEPINITYGSTVMFECNEGYFIEAELATTECQSDGQWSSPIPKCFPVDCGNPGSVEMGTQNINASYTFQSTVTFTCNDGYEINGSNSISCNASGQWSGPLPTCSIVSCQILQPPTNGDLSVTSLTYGSVVNFNCNSGYHLVGSSSTICGKDKQWSNQTPVCNRVCDTFDVTLPLQIVTTNEAYFIGDVIRFACAPTYTLIGDSSLVCTSNGEWNGDEPSCMGNPITQVPTTSTGSSTTSSTAAIPSNSTNTGTNAPPLPSSTNIEQDSSSQPLPFIIIGGAVGVLIFLILLILIAVVFVLLVARTRRGVKQKYDVGEGQAPLDGGVSLQPVSTGGQRTETGTLVPSYNEAVKMRQKQSTTMAVPARYNPDGPLIDTMNRVASMYEVPVITSKQLQAAESNEDEVKVDLSEGPDVTMASYEAPVNLRRDSKLDTLVKKDLSAEYHSSMRASTYEVPVTIKSQTGTLNITEDFDLPPPIHETSFCESDKIELTYIGGDDDSDDEIPVKNKTEAINQLYMETQIEQPEYSELDQAIISGNETDGTNILYSEIDTQPSPAGTSRRGTNMSLKTSTSIKESRRKTVIFQAPAEDTDELYSQLKRQKVEGIRSENIHLGKILGSGYFGKVYKAEMKVNPSESDDTIEVAVKTLNADATDKDKVKFLQEAAIMAQFDNVNVLKLHGVVVTRGSCMIVTELMAKGDLLNVLAKMRPDPGLLINEDIPYVLLNFSRQVCLGLSYLEQKGFVHRDIAARNILVDANNTCKVADFGLSRDLEDDNYYMANEGAKVPVKWTAPEALHYRKYSTASDVWSYGCLLYEIWSLGTKPFHKMSNMQSLEKVMEGYRLPPPPGCPKEFYGIMIQCWHPEKDERPSFQDMMMTMIMPDKMVLAIPEEDLSTHPLAGTIGATIEAGNKMYEKLQMTYS